MSTPPAADAVCFRRLAGVALGVFVCLAGAVALTAYCGSLNREYRKEQARGATAPPPPVAAEQSPGAAEPDGSLLSPKERAEVRAAVLRGVRFLKTTQEANGTWAGTHPVGYAALPALTLLECGVPASDPTVQKAAAFVRNHTARVTNTYVLSLAVLFLDRLGDPRDRERIQTMALRLVAGLNATGGWTYECPILSAAAHKQLFTLLKESEARPDDRLGKLTGSAPLLPELRALPVTQDLVALQGKTFRPFDGDNSNTQFGILALWVARRHEVPLGRTAALVLARFRRTQTADGSWPYTPGYVISPATTCAGLLGLAIGQGAAVGEDVETTRPDDDPAVRKALVFLGKAMEHYGAGEAGPARMADLYFLWSLERVAVLYGLKEIDRRDWYAWAREVLLTHQEEKGHWQDGGYPGSTPTIDTCFALLTLLQANLAKDLTSKMELLGRGK